MLSIARSVLIFAAAIWFCWWALQGSPTFKTCIQQDQKQTSGNQPEDYIAAFSAGAAIYRDCLGDFVHDRKDEILVAFTVILAFSTLFLWVATRDLVSGSEKTARRQLRAYVGVRTASCSDWQEGMRPFASITIANAGQTPAYDLTFWAYISVEPFPLKTGEILRDIDDLGRSPLGPGSTNELSPRFIKPLAREEADALSAGTLALYVKGRASYRDAFKVSRTTEFIFVSGGSKPIGAGMRPYHKGNKAT
jgi:hypothetical protein